MAVAATGTRTPVVTGGYRRILVPILGGPASERAVETACRLAAERRSTVTALVVVEVPPAFPLDARMVDEELEAREAFDRAESIADAFGVSLQRRQIRAREAGTAILEELEGGAFQLVVLSAPRRERLRKGAAAFGRTVQQVLKKAPCRVLMIAPPKS